MIKVVRPHYQRESSASECWLTCRVETPISVEHELVLEVLFSVHGEDKFGRPTAGPAELRVMRIKLPLIVPSVRQNQLGQAYLLIVLVRAHPVSAIVADIR